MNVFLSTQSESCGKNGPPSTSLSFSEGLGLGYGFLVRYSFHMILQSYNPLHVIIHYTVKQKQSYKLHTGI